MPSWPFTMCTRAVDPAFSSWKRTRHGRSCRRHGCRRHHVARALRPVLHVLAGMPRQPPLHLVLLRRMAPPLRWSRILRRALAQLLPALAGLWSSPPWGSARRLAAVPRGPSLQQHRFARYCPRLVRRGLPDLCRDLPVTINPGVQCAERVWRRVSPQPAQRVSSSWLVVGKFNHTRSALLHVSLWLFLNADGGASSPNRVPMLGDVAPLYVETPDLRWYIW